MLSVKVTGTILRAACQLTFIKQAIKQQITGLYGFIMLDAMLCYAGSQPWAEGWGGGGVVLVVGRWGECWQDSLVLGEVCCPNGCHHVHVCSG